MHSYYHKQLSRKITHTYNLKTGAPPQTTRVRQRACPLLFIFFIGFRDRCNNLALNNDAQNRYDVLNICENVCYRTIICESVCYRNL